ncbi:hypothetical protein [Paenibacillus sp. FSL W8-0194]
MASKYFDPQEYSDMATVLIKRSFIREGRYVLKDWMRRAIPSKARF